MNTIFKYETASNAETAQFKEKDINMTEKYFKIRAIVMTVFIIVTFAVFAVSCDKNSAETENSNTTTTQVTTTTSDEDDVTTTARPKETTTTKATTTAVTTTTSDEEDVTTTTTMATTTTNAQTTTTTTKATTTTTAQTTTTKASEPPVNTTTPIQIPSTAVTIPIDTTQKVANANDVAIVLLKSVGVDTTGVNISNTTDPEQFTEELQDYLNSISSSYSVFLGYTDFPTSSLGRITDEGRIFAFFGTDGPVVIWGADIETRTIYGLNSNGIVVYTLEEYLESFGAENYDVCMTW